MKSELIAATRARHFGAVDQHHFSTFDTMPGAGPVDTILLPVRNVRQEVSVSAPELRLFAELGIVFANHAIGTPGASQFFRRIRSSNNHRIGIARTLRRRELAGCTGCVRLRGNWALNISAMAFRTSPQAHKSADCEYRASLGGQRNPKHTATAVGKPPRSRHSLASVARCPYISISQEYFYKTPATGSFSPPSADFLLVASNVRQRFRRKS